jgi:hypothetical protein
MDNKVLGREIKRGIELGRVEGVQQGVHLGALKILRSLVEERFGPFPTGQRRGLAVYRPNAWKHWAFAF